jgi:hypothetical protein
VHSVDVLRAALARGRAEFAREWAFPFDIRVDVPERVMTR